MYTVDINVGGCVCVMCIMLYNFTVGSFSAQSGILCGTSSELLSINYCCGLHVLTMFSLSVLNPKEHYIFIKFYY